MKVFIFNHKKKEDYQLAVNGKELKRIELLRNMKPYFANKLYEEIPMDFLNDYNIISKEDPDYVRFSKLFQKKFTTKDLELSERQQRAVATLVGLAIGDALGSTTQFQDYQKFRKDPYFVKGFKDIEDKLGKEVSTRFGETRVWTDDCSMALAIADSLLLNQFQFNPVHIRYMFTLWLRHGLNNGEREESIGLGGNIQISMKEFMQHQTEFTEKGSQNNSGNGSLMRLAPIPIAFRASKEAAMKYSELQSYTTHNGIEAAQCCRLLGGLIVTLINRKYEEKWREEMLNFLNKFQTKSTSVAFLARSKMQTEAAFEQHTKRLKDHDLQNFRLYNKTPNDRNWDWQSKDFNYSPTRVQLNSGYIGSYCMDGLAMALHIVWTKKSFRECVIWAANMGGDCDTVGAIACQIAGAIYSFNAEMIDLYSQMKDYTTKKYLVFIKAFKLAKGKTGKIVWNSS